MPKKVEETKKIRKFRCTKGLTQLQAISHELMIRRVVYEIRIVAMKGLAVPEIVTRDELTETARNEIVREANKAMVK